MSQQRYSDLITMLSKCDLCQQWKNNFFLIIRINIEVKNYF